MIRVDFDPDLHYLRHGYTPRVPPEYFVDIDNGITWQPDVYPEVLVLAQQHDRRVIIDLGCGRAGKLVALAAQHPHLDLVGIDFGPNIEWCRANLPVGRWLDADLEAATTLPLDTEVIARSVVVCSDVLEHLIDPRPAMRLICWLLDRGAACAVVSTPARDKRAGTENLGPPANPSHVREWAQDEFRAFVESFPAAIERFGLTRSDDSGGGMTTQLVVLGPCERQRAG
ncbi:class I SAM-dependent methyltransferase [Saccharopolyspora spinosa]|uniref:Methyltransferase family protein n=1 Tax=Saccharopolyspora spinosa TaxID=60894 RepID=A0A2N3Y772_SACSN|nr:class I SAM-dependent methyltransferase [Saccharopolyspora spinosa]PKW18715.1 methyltransferase family protein [Saccharopolyspora spinosa]